MSGSASVANRIRDIRRSRELTQEELAAMLGEDTFIATVSRLESGRMTLTLPWMQRISNALGVSPHEIIAEPGKGLRMVPVIGVIAAGTWRQALEEPEGYIPAIESVGGPNCFALRPVGDSMNLVADENSYIIVDPDQTALDNGRIYAIRNVDGEATFKRFNSDPPRLEPMSSNPEHKPILIGQELFTVIGRVTYVGREL
jgi:repressor LexA